MGIKLYNEKWEVGIKRVKDKSIDLIFADMPYGTTNNEWDKIPQLSLLWEEYNRVIKDNGAIVLFAQAPFDKILACSNLELFRYEWIWEKNKATGFLNSKKMPLKSHENLLVFYKKLPTYNPIMSKGHLKVSKAKSKTNCIKSSNYGKQYFRSDYCSSERYPRSILKFPKDTISLHPTQKPVALCRYIIETYTNVGDVVLDNFFGSCSSGEACVQTNRSFIGFEAQTSIFNVGLERIKIAQGRTGLFRDNNQAVNG